MTLDLEMGGRSLAQSSSDRETPCRSSSEAFTALSQFGKLALDQEIPFSGDGKPGLCQGLWTHQVKHYSFKSRGEGFKRVQKLANLFFFF